MQKRLSTSEQVILELNRKGITKQELAKHLGVSRPALDARLKYNDWLLCEIIKLASILDIK